MLSLRNYRAEVDTIRRYRRRERDAQAAVRKFESPRQVAKRAKTLRRVFPHASPKVILPLAQTGWDIDSPEIAKLIEVETRRRAKLGQFTKPGEESDPVEAARRAIESLRERGLVFTDAATQLQPAGFRMSIGDEKWQRIEEAAPKLAQIIRAGEEAQPTGGGPFDAIGEAVGFLAKPFTEEKYQHNFAGIEVPGARDVSRAAFTAVDTPLQFINASIRQAVGKITGESSSAPVPGELPFQSTFEQLPAYHAIRGESLGDGLFPDPDSPAYEEAAKVAREVAPTIHGRAWTPGRFVANTVLEPGSTAYDLVSGGIDALVTLKADPTNPLFDAWTAARREGRIVTADRPDTPAMANLINRKASVRQAQRDLDLARDAIRRGEAVDLGASRSALDLARRERDTAQIDAIAEAGARRGLHPFFQPRTTTEWYATGAGADLIQGHLAIGGPSLVEARDRITTLTDEIADLAARGADEDVLQPLRAERSALETQHVQELGKAIRTTWLGYGRKGPVEFHAKMAYAQTTDEAMEVLDTYLPTQLREVPPASKIRPGYKPALDKYRWAQIVPNGGLTPDDPEESLVQLDRWARNALLDVPAQEELIGRAALAETPRDWLDVAKRAADMNVAREVSEHGLSPEWARAASRLFNNADTIDAHAYFVNGQTGENVFHPLAIVNEAGSTLPSPHLPTELISTEIPLPDPRVIRKLTKKVGGFAARRHSQADALEEWARVLRQSLGDEGVNVERVTAEIRRAERAAKRARHIASGKDYADLWMGGRLVREEAGFLRWDRGRAERAMSWWRTARLFRAAWGVRVAGEGQARLWQHGLPNFFSHPIEALSIAVGANPESRLGRMLGRLSSQTITESDNLGQVLSKKMGKSFGDWFGKYRAGPTGEITVAGKERFVGGLVAEEDIADALNKPFSAIYETTNPIVLGKPVEARAYDVVPRGHARHAEGIADEILRLGHDPIARHVANSPSTQESVEWLLRGDGRKTWDYMVRPDSIVRMAEDDAGRLAGELSQADLEAFAHAYVETVADRIYQITQGDARLRQAVATRKIDDLALSVDDKKMLIGKVNETIDSGWAGPKYVKVARSLSGHTRAAAGNALNQFMWNLMPRPDNFFNRMPAVKALRWKRAEELIPLMSPKAKARLLENAQGAARVPKKVLRRMAATPAGAADGLTLKEANELATAYALQTTRDILYDLSERHQGWDQLRMIFPFGEAFQEVTQRWLKYAWENPKTLRRLGQVSVQGKANGTFTEGPYGDQVFSYGPVGWMSDKMIGAPVPMSGSLSGLNIVGSGMPGVGPAVQIPALALLPDTPDWQKVRDFIFPYGEGQYKGGLDEALTNFALPNWARYAMQYFESPEGHKQFGDTTMYMMDYLASTGEYDLYGDDYVAETNRLFNDAKDKAKWVSVLRGFMSFSAPSAPIPEWVIKNKDNRLVEIDVIREKYYKIADEKGYDAALDWLIDRHGALAFFAVSGHTEGEGFFPRTKNQWEFVAENPWIEDEYREIYGLLVPPAKGEFDIENYTRIQDKGLKEPKDARERYDQARSRLAAYYYDQEAAKYPDPDKKEQVHLDRVKKILENDYGYNLQTPDFNATKRHIRDLERAANDPRLQAERPELTGALTTYLALREHGIGLQTWDNAPKNSISSAKRKEAQDIRDWLLDEGRRLARRYPDFRAVWREVFLREIPEEEDEE